MTDVFGDASGMVIIISSVGWDTEFEVIEGNADFTLRLLNPSFASRGERGFKLDASVGAP